MHSAQTSCLVLLLLVAGCRTYDNTTAIVPFFEIYDQKAEFHGPGKAPADTRFQPKGDINDPVDGDIVDGDTADRNTAASREFVLRPFGSFEHISDGARARTKFLWPIGDFAWGRGHTRHWFLPLFFYRNRPIHDANGSDLDWLLLPLFFGGSDPREGRYFAVFPLGGKTYGLLGKDETHFVLFPLYLRWWQKGHDSMHLVFPFFNRVRGAGHSGWRLTPFYGHYDAELANGTPRYRRTFILWPFYIRQENNLDTSRPTQVFFTFPLYGKTTNSNTEVSAYLWPFFHVATDVKSKEKLYFGYILPHRFTGGHYDFWPIFGWKDQKADVTFASRDLRGIAGPKGWAIGSSSWEESERRVEIQPSSLRTRFRQFGLWPIQRYDTDQGRTWISTKFWLLPLFWHFQTIDKDRLEVTSEWKVWPLLRYRHDRNGTSFYFPSPLPFRSEDLFERLYARLWRLILYKDTPERSGWEFTYGFLSYRHEKEEAEEVFAIFYGLFEWRSSEKGQQFRLLYLPWRS